MTDYSKMSDFEINLEVAKVVIGAVWFLEKSPRSESSVFVTNHMGSGGDDFDPCNSWADAGPVIVDNKINLNSTPQGWVASDNGGHDSNYFPHTDPLRAAMIVFLMMKESK